MCWISCPLDNGNLRTYPSSRCFLELCATVVFYPPYRPLISVLSFARIVFPTSCKGFLLYLLL